MELNWLCFLSFISDLVHKISTQTDQPIHDNIGLGDIQEIILISIQSSPLTSPHRKMIQQGMWITFEIIDVQPVDLCAHKTSSPGVDPWSGPEHVVQRSTSCEWINKGAEVNVFLEQPARGRGRKKQANKRFQWRNLLHQIVLLLLLWWNRHDYDNQTDQMTVTASCPFLDSCFLLFPKVFIVIPLSLASPHSTCVRWIMTRSDGPRPMLPQLVGCGSHGRYFVSLHPMFIGKRSETPGVAIMSDSERTKMVLLRTVELSSITSSQNITCWLVLILSHPEVPTDTLLESGGLWSFLKTDWGAFSPRSMVVSTETEIACLWTIRS